MAGLATTSDKPGTPPIAALCALVLVAALLRAVEVGTMSLRGDEAVSLWYASLPLSDLFLILREQWPHPPLYYLLLRGWVQLAGESILALRLPGFLAGLLVVPLTYQASRVLSPHGPRFGAILGAALAAICPFLVSDAQDVRSYALFFAMALASTVIYLRGMILGWNRRRVMGYSVVTLLSMYLHYLAVVVLTVQCVVWVILVIFGRADRRRTMGWASGLLPAMLLFAPWVLWAMPALTGGGANVGALVDLPGLIVRTGTAYTIGLAVVWTPFPAPLAAMAALGYGLPLLAFAASALSARPEPGGPSGSGPVGWRAGGVTAVAWLAAPAAMLYAFSLWRYPIYDERYALLGVTGLEVLVGWGLAALLRSQRWLGVLCAVLVVAASVGSLWLYHTDASFSKSPYWTAFVDRLTTLAMPGDTLVQNYPDPALPYHLNGRMARVLLPAQAEGGDPETERWLQKLAAGSERIWFQPQESAWDPDGLVETRLQRSAVKVGEEPIGLLRLALYLPPTRLLGPRAMPRATLAESIYLAGWAARVGPAGLESEPGAGLPAAIARDRPLTLFLLWGASPPPPVSYTMFVHGYKADGTLCTQHDGPPVQGQYPTDRWRPGEIVVDEHVLSFDACPAGAFITVDVGMYDSRSLARAAATGETGEPLRDGLVVLGRLRVE